MNAMSAESAIPYLRSSGHASALTSGRWRCHSRHDRSTSLAVQPVQPPAADESAIRNLSREITNGAATATQFFLTHRGRCFDGWPASRIFQYVLWHLLNGTLFVAYQTEHEISHTRGINPQSAIRGGRGANRPHSLAALAVIAWPENSLKIRALAAYGMPQFVWQSLPTEGDSILIADVAGDRKLMPEILKQVMARWPDAPCKQLFTYRRGKLIELHWTTVMRFSQLRNVDCGLRNIPRPGDQRTIGNHSAIHGAPVQTTPMAPARTAVNRKSEQSEIRNPKSAI